MTRLALALILACATSPLARAQVGAAAGAVPYSVRSKSFNGWSTTVHGDVRTVGMSGAAVGLADTFIAGTYNPAGIAMTLDIADSNYTTQTSKDGAIQNPAAQINTNNLGASIDLFPWGISLGYVAPYDEGQIYTSPTVPTQSLDLSVEIRELHAEFAHLFLGGRLSLGADLILGQALELVNPLADPSSGGSASPVTVGGTLGGLYQLPGRVLLGLSFSMPMHYAGDTFSQPTPGLPGFLKPVEVPGRIGFGVGWIPNRFFRTELSGVFVGTTPNTALIRDESAIVGSYPVIEQHFGLAYRLMDYKAIRTTVFAGTYREVSRIEGEPTRQHLTWGVELQPWVMTLGWGLDSANGYQSYLFSVGVDVVRVMSKLNVVPWPAQPDPAGLLPNPFQISDAGIARALNPSWRPGGGTDINPVKAALDVPGKLKDVPKNVPGAIEKTKQDFEETGKQLLENVKEIPGGLKHIVQPQQ